MQKYKLPSVSLNHACLSICFLLALVVLTVDELVLVIGCIVGCRSG